jgi:acetyl-CoA C-acetyltransferase
VTDRPTRPIRPNPSTGLTMPTGPAGQPDARIPILVGVGTASTDAEAVELMALATEAALRDAGGRGLAAAVDRVAVPQGSWTYRDPARLVARRIGAPAATTHLVELGIPQQSVVNDALAAILSGASDVAVVVGGESKRWARERERAELSPETAQSGADPDVLRRRPGPLLEPVEVAHRLWDPVQQYAMIDNALRAAEGRTIAEHRAEIADLWDRMNAVAVGNPDAAFPERMDAVRIATATPANRPLAFPYNKWHSTQWTVNQAAALVLCSVDAARRMGVPSDRWVFPLVGLESSHAVSMLCRERIHAWPAMEVLGGTAAVRIGRPVDQIELVELYSCFPAAVRVQQRSLGMATDGTPTITGGMAFAGGPFNNAVLQSVAAVVPRLRAAPDLLGAVTTVSGLLTKPGLGVWSARPDGRPPLLSDLAYEVASVTGVVEAVEDLDGYEGPGTVATYTVTYDGMDPVRVVAVCDTADGRRCVSIGEDEAVAARACREELVGAPVWIGSGTFTPV